MVQAVKARTEPSRAERLASEAGASVAWGRQLIGQINASDRITKRQRAALYTGLVGTITTLKEQEARLNEMSQSWLKKNLPHPFIEEDVSKAGRVLAKIAAQLWLLEKTDYGKGTTLPDVEWSPMLERVILLKDGVEILPPTKEKNAELIITNEANGMKFRIEVGPNGEPLEIIALRADSATAIGLAKLSVSGTEVAAKPLDKSVAKDEKALLGICEGFRLALARNEHLISQLTGGKLHA